MTRIHCQAADGFQLPAYQASPKGTPKAGVVVLHEAFGVTPHIQDMADWLAAQGYLAVAPELFARAEADPAKRVLAYNNKDFMQGREYIKAISRDDWVKDCAAAVAYLQGQGLHVAAVGYCWGGSLAYMTACNVPGLACADCYYGGLIPDLVKAMKPKCPVQFHVAEHDRYFPVKEALEAIRTEVPQAKLFVYDADHGFNRNGGITYDEGAAQVARARTLEFLQANIDS